jgi:hypothetical protein
MARRPTRLWTWLFHSDAEWGADIETGLFCLSLGFVAKFVIDVPILQWLMVAAGAGYVALGIVKGQRAPD